MVSVYERDGFKAWYEGPVLKLGKTDGTAITGADMNRIMNVVFWGRPEGGPTAEELEVERAKSAATFHQMVNDFCDPPTERVTPPCPLAGGDCACLDPGILPPGVTNACSAIHHHFGLSYATYLVLRRSILQSMPRAWQAKFVTLLRELDEAASGLKDPVSVFRVTPTDENGQEVNDPYFFYDRGRRQIPLKGA